MRFRASDENLLNQIGERVRGANAASPNLFALVLDKACPRLTLCKPTVMQHLHRLLETDAYADAPLTVIEFELPTWKLRRLIFDAGEWHCLLSRKPWVPI